MNSSNTVKEYNRIESLNGIKVIAMLLLFWWHSSIPKPNTDLGARTCEILFVVSGFLIGYNNFYKEVDATWKKSVEYVISKIVKFWPLHFCTFLVMFVWEMHVIRTLQAKYIISAFINIFLLQAWSPNIEQFFSYNGASWFLSSLLFCYFVSPALLYFAKKVKASLIMFAVVAMIRLFTEMVICAYPNEFWNFSIHTFPLIRCMEFFMGMLLVPTFMAIKNRLQGNHCFLFTFIELSVAFLTIYLTISKNDMWYRGTFVILYCLLVFVYAFDSGYFSVLLNSKAFKSLGKIQFEIYMLHQVIISTIGHILSKVISDWKILNAILLISILICSIIYKKFFDQLFSRWLNKAIVKIREVLC